MSATEAVDKWQSMVMLKLPDDDEIRDIFNLFDRDNNGRITADELRTVLRVLGQNPTPKQLKELMDEADHDRSGYIDFKEFKVLMSAKWRETQERDLYSAFQVFDRNRDGFIERDELKYVMVNAGEDPMTSEEVDHVIDSMIFEADLNNDSKINYAEFTKVICQKR